MSAWDDKLKAAGRLAPADLVSAWAELVAQHKGELRQLLVEERIQVWKDFFGVWDEAALGPAPLWAPPQSWIETTQVAKLCRHFGLPVSWDSLIAFSLQDRSRFFAEALVQCGFLETPIGLDPFFKFQGHEGKTEVMPAWKGNIASCALMGDDDQPAIFSSGEHSTPVTMTRRKLRELCARTAHFFKQQGVRPGDSVGIFMSLGLDAAVAYLSLVWMGACVVSIADSFSGPEIQTRMSLTSTKFVVTQAVMHRGGKQISLYDRLIEINAPKVFVFGKTKRAQDVSMTPDLNGPQETPYLCSALDTSNFLFSSGTTGEPKVIPWSHSTPFRCALDAALILNLGPGDALHWPTSLGWMMGPWLLYAGLFNRATVALWDGLPAGPKYQDFLTEAQVTVLGTVPSLVKAWKESKLLETLPHKIRAFASTGEASHPSDMIYLSACAGFAPIAEYCGGTEIGGAYICSHLFDLNRPSCFSGPTPGLNFHLLDEDQRPTDTGEVFLEPPSLGLSTTLLNKNHFDVYFKGSPSINNVLLRKHGDQISRIADGVYRAQGRVDDTMNLGGIKVSSAEIERVLSNLKLSPDLAAVAIDPAGGGPSQLLVVVAKGKDIDEATLKAAFNAALKKDLNPLFRVTHVAVIDKLPRTASNKILRRELRREFNARLGGLEP